MNTALTPPTRQRETGFSLIELMIAMAIAMIITGALMVLFTNVLKTNREQFKAAQQIENGRYATDLLATNIQLAGFYGEFSALPSASAFSGGLPDPCDVSPSSTGTGRLKEGTVTSSTTDSPLAFYVQGYNSSGTTVKASVPTTCQTWIDTASIAAGSDILVVRRFDTIPLVDPSATPAVTSATPVSGKVYVQAVNGTLDVQYGNAAAAIDACKDARGDAIASSPGTCVASAGTSALTRKDFTQAATGTPATRPRVASYIRALHTDIYYVSPCRSGSGANGKCTAADDTIPTLKRLELSASAGSATMTVVPLVEGIEFFKVRYGLDNGSTSGIAGAQVNGTVDQVLATPATVADWQNVVMVEVRLISRNLEPSVIGSAAANTDTKTYDLGSGITYTPSGTAALYKRHAFTQKIFLQNIGGRRES